MPDRHPSADQCSDEDHLWRMQPAGHMACRCGAVHPNDLDDFFADPVEAPDE